MTRRYPRGSDTNQTAGALRSQRRTASARWMRSPALIVEKRCASARMQKGSAAGQSVGVATGVSRAAEAGLREVRRVASTSVRE